MLNISRAADVAYNNMLPMQITLRREFGDPIWNDQDVWSTCWSTILNETDIETEGKKIRKIRANIQKHNLPK